MSDVKEMMQEEWKTIVLGIWLAAVTGLMIFLSIQISNLRTEVGELKLTADSIENVIISTDSNIATMNERMRKLEANMEYIVQRVKRR